MKLIDYKFSYKMWIPHISKPYEAVITNETTFAEFKGSAETDIYYNGRVLCNLEIDIFSGELTDLVLVAIKSFLSLAIAHDLPEGTKQFYQIVLNALGDV